MNCYRDALGRGMASADTEIEAIERMLSHTAGPTTILTWLTDRHPGPTPETAVRSRHMKHGLRAGLAKGHLGVPGNEVVDGEAKSGAGVVDPAHPYGYLTAVWAPGEDSRKWREAKISDEWGAGHLLTWKRADIRGGSMQMLHDLEGNMTAHITVECPTFERDCTIRHPRRGKDARNVGGVTRQRRAHPHPGLCSCPRSIFILV